MATTPAVTLAHVASVTTPFVTIRTKIAARTANLPTRPTSAAQALVPATLKRNAQALHRIVLQTRPEKMERLVGMAFDVLVDSARQETCNARLSWATTLPATIRTHATTPTA